MKNVIVAGVSRAGKSTLAKKIANDYQMTYIPFDSIVSTLENLYPEVGIGHMDDNIEMSKNIAVFLKEYIKHLEYEDIGYILDLYQVFPDDLSEVYSEKSHVVVYLGYSTMSAEEKLKFVRKHARDKDWTKNTADSQMIGILNLFIKESRLMQEQCLANNISFFDTGTSYNDSLNAAYEYTTKKLNE